MTLALTRQNKLDIMELRDCAHYSYTRIHQELGLPYQLITEFLESRPEREKRTTPKHHRPANERRAEEAVLPATMRPPLRPNVTDPSLLAKIVRGR